MAEASQFHPDDEAVRILAAIVESSEDAIIGKDLDGTVRTWNPGAERMYGYTAAEVIGRPISLLVPEALRAELKEILADIASGKRLDAFETQRITKGGRLIDVSLSVSPIRDAAGRVVGASAIARDITTRKDAERALRHREAQWRSIFNSAVDGIIVIDDRGLVEAFNPAAESLFGYTAAEIVGQNVTRLMPSPYREEHDRYLEHYQRTGERKIIGIGREVMGRRKDGTTFPLHLAVGEMLAGGTRKFTGILHDLTDRVRLEERLRDQSALARLGEMAAVLAHEVKNPLAGVRGAIQVIAQRLPREGKERGVMQQIIERIDGLNLLMQDLLLFARPPQPHPTPVDLVSLLDMTAALVTEDASLRNVRIDVAGTAPPIMADAELLKIVFHNLLVNGAHAIQGSGAIRVSVAPSDRICAVAISDSGPGIPPDIREKMFTPFFTTKARGTGLGLPTAKRLVEAHAGRILVDCPPGGGTVVTVQLPMTPIAGFRPPV